MRLALIIFAALICGNAVNAQALEHYFDSVENSRSEKQQELKSKKASPLQKADRKRLDHLNFFPVQIHYNVDALFFLIDEGEEIDMSTSNGAVKKFKKHGYFIFAYYGNTDTLCAYSRIYPKGYESPYAPHLFVPFTDSTSGFETYGGGRYLETAFYDSEQQVKLDFNASFNPYCAYGDGFSCPIPPIEIS